MLTNIRSSSGFEANKEEGLSPSYLDRPFEQLIISNQNSENKQLQTDITERGEDRSSKLT